MMVFHRKQRGFLIFILGFVLFLGALEISLLSMIEITLGRVVQAKRLETAKNLSSMGETYATVLAKKFNGNFFPALKQKGSTILTVENEGSGICRYVYNSPPMMKDGYFALTGFYKGNRLEKITSTGHFEGITWTRQVNLK